MSALAITCMLFVCSFVWGGFALLLARAVRREAAKARAGSGS